MIDASVEWNSTKERKVRKATQVQRVRLDFKIPALVFAGIAAFGTGLILQSGTISLTSAGST